MKSHRRSTSVAVWMLFAVSAASLPAVVPTAAAEGPEMPGDGTTGRGMMDQGAMGRGMMGENWGSAARHRQYMASGVPEPYASMADPLPRTSEVTDRGRTLFEANCAACHGPRGLGNGEAAGPLSPRPSNLAALTSMPMMRDEGYAYWAIATGGEPFGTAMPAFGNVLSADEIWSVIHYLQAGLPPIAGPKPGQGAPDDAR